MSALRRRFAVEDDKETVAVLARATVHLWMAGRPNFGWRWEGLNGWYGHPEVVTRAAQAYTRRSHEFEDFPSSAIPTILINMLQYPLDISNKSIELLETTVVDPRNLGLVACYLQWIPDVLSTSRLPRFPNPLKSDRQEHPPRNACEGMAAMYQEFTR